MPCNLTFTVISPGPHCRNKSSTGYQKLMGSWHAGGLYFNQIGALGAFLILLS
jgi:hypothetical protein